MDASIYAIGGVSAVFIVGWIVSLIMSTGKVNSPYYPIISGMVGILVGILWAYVSGESYITGIVAGMVLGAATSGNYDALTGVNEMEKNK